MSPQEKNKQNDPTSPPARALENYDFEAARTFYRNLDRAPSRNEFAELISADRKSMHLHLKRAWTQTRAWYIGSMLAELCSTEESMQIYRELLNGELSDPDRWRIQCKRINLALTRGGASLELAEDFVSAWEFLQGLGTKGASLRQGMARMLARADHESAIDFLDRLLEHPRFPPMLVELARTKRHELGMVLTVT